MRRGHRVLTNVGGAARTLSLVLAMLALVALACNAPSRPVAEAQPQDLPSIPTRPAVTSTATDTPTPTLTPAPSSTPTPTATATATSTAIPTVTPSLTPSLTPTASNTVDPNAAPSATPTRTPTASATPRTATATDSPPSAASGPNRLANPGFEGGWRPVIFPEVSVFGEWEPWYCSEPYTSDPCPIPAEWDPFEPWMKRPEYTPGNRATFIEPCSESPYANRVHGGCNSQQWFAFSAVARAGVFQVADGLQPGTTYELSAYVQLWSMEGSDPSNPTLPCVRRDSENACIDWGNDPFTSDVATEDDLTSIFAILGVDPTCGTNAFDEDVEWSRAFGHADGLYDRFGRIAMTFVAERDCATVYLGGYNRFAKTHNNWYLDDAALR